MPDFAYRAIGRDGDPTGAGRQCKVRLGLLRREKRLQTLHRVLELPPHLHDLLHGIEHRPKEGLHRGAFERLEKCVEQRL